MGRPRLIILVRHAQSEGNRNRAIHQTVPDHRVKLTPEGIQQAEDAGRRLRALLHPDDTLQFYTSPYRRTRETADGILRTLTSDDPAPSPFPLHTIKVWEEPRLREQDFGNFQPCSAAMERMWQERADYGHFFYRIPNGESAADAYDRIAGFNESLWRGFAEDDFPSVCVVVTHGLMTRVFLMKWYHWSVEYFEDLRNVNHCEFVVMQRSDETHKYVLQYELRTWSELKRRVAEERKQQGLPEPSAPAPVPKKRWGGCPDGCTHGQDDYPRRPSRHDTIVARPRNTPTQPAANAPSDTQPTPPVSHPTTTSSSEEDDEAFPRQPNPNITTRDLPAPLRQKPQWLQAGRDFGGSESGMATPATAATPVSHEFAESGKDAVASEREGRIHSRTPSARERDWVAQSGMGVGARADALGDQDGSASEDGDGVGEGEGEGSVRGDVY